MPSWWRVMEFDRVKSSSASAARSPTRCVRWTTGRTARRVSTTAPRAARAATPRTTCRATTWTTPPPGQLPPDTPSTAGTHTDRPGSGATHTDGPSVGGGHHEPPSPGSAHLETSGTGGVDDATTPGGGAPVPNRVPDPPSFMRQGDNPYSTPGSLKLEQITEIQVYRAGVHQGLLRGARLPPRHRRPRRERLPTAAADQRPRRSEDVDRERQCSVGQVPPGLGPSGYRPAAH